MKKLFALFTIGFLLLFTLPQEAQAQCPSNADSNPCYSLPTGSCVCFPSGKLRLWVSAPVLIKAKTVMASQFPNYSLSDFIKAYYITGELGIEYMGGSWGSGQTFRVEMQDGNPIIVVVDGL